MDLLILILMLQSCSFLGVPCLENVDMPMPLSFFFLDGPDSPSLWNFRFHAIASKVAGPFNDLVLCMLHAVP